jgi:O-antigen ligase
MSESPNTPVPVGADDVSPERRPAWIRRIDAVAALVVALIFAGGFLTHGYVDEGSGRLYAWLGCGLLGAWAAIGYPLGRWDGNRMAAARLFVLLLALALLFSLLHVIPLPAGLVTALSPAWKGIVQSFADSGIDTSATLTLSLAPEKTWNAIQHLVAALLFFPGVALLACHRSGALRLIILVTLVSLLEGFHGLFNYLIGEAPRASGSVYNPNHFAVIVVIGLPLYFTALLEWKRQSPSLSDDLLGGRNPLLLFIGLGIVAGLGWITALSRSSVFVSGFVLLLWLLVEVGQRFGRRDEERGTSTASLVVGAVAALLVLFMASLFLEGFLDRLFSGDAMTANSRVKIWKASLRGLAESNYLGVGLGGSEFMIDRFANYPLVSVPIWSHSDYIQWLCDLGLPAFAVLVVVAGFFLRACGRVLGEQRARFSFAHGLLKRAAMVGTAIALLHAFLDFHLRVPQVCFMALTLIALSLQSGILKVMRRSHALVNPTPEP